MTKFQKLLSPLPLGQGGPTLKNRIIMGSLTRNRNLVPQQVNIDYYTQRAKGGTGLILTEGTLVAPQGTEWPNAPGIYTEEQTAAWKKVVDSVHKAGGTIFLQLWHVGRVAHPDMPIQKATGKPVPGPSAIAARGGKFRQLNNAEYVTPHAVENPHDIVMEYSQAAKNAKEAGFDGVELHCANGYLPNQFLETVSNQRTDKYGGSIENRMRFPLEILDEIFKHFNKKQVGIKLSPAGGYNDVGEHTMEELRATYVPFYTKLNEINIAYIQTMRPGFGDPMYGGVPRSQKELDIFKEFRHLVTGPKFFANYDYSPEEAEQHIQEGKADAVVFGRYMITNPDFAKRVEQGVEFTEQGNPEKDVPLWYGFPEGHPEKGYSDYEAKL
ncbi:FMN-linked oxidoreductase [Saitoella complicata NRRL Y-17804]|uniref:NADH:flavin oxidoreductase/NADH oxidase N-terminal domain-containing protein n=1 Tax=Saitoella complicata (strain BCRC 22490 / CBS 7301 / JCM 7358 / NBRC 10748 / NRRL Y-17804) TaxID=698492 RepID=A0A0E9NP10_SAICN|nr:FMN-linked oxidoreductase [Saitoella complicata NRRL Y-17804]ODQ54976.1 FMN-linked oxidoreductase [Saitoella complicata NRRL Y-17804]GAO51538.1 hypothetical protein G7K_5637-t1 [Saitoella complicata NRRL Y-17804]